MILQLLLVAVIAVLGAIIPMTIFKKNQKLEMTVDKVLKVVKVGAESAVPKLQDNKIDPEEFGAWMADMAREALRK